LNTSVNNSLEELNSKGVNLINAIENKTNEFDKFIKLSILEINKSSEDFVETMKSKSSHYERIQKGKMYFFIAAFIINFIGIIYLVYMTL